MLIKKTQAFSYFIKTPKDSGLTKELLSDCPMYKCCSVIVLQVMIIPNSDELIFELVKSGDYRI